MKQEMLQEQKEFRNELWKLAVPVTLQGLLQSSFSVVDQVMTGQLGSVSIAAIGLCGKFIYLLTVMVQAVAVVAGIIITQAVGKGDRREAGKGFYTNFLISLILAAIFTVAGLLLPEQIIHIYSEDTDTIVAASSYLRIYALSFLPMAVTSILSTYLRCVGAAAFPLYAGLCAAVFNTGLNYVLIFGKWGFPVMGVRGAAVASVISQIAGCLVVLAAFLIIKSRKNQLMFAVYQKQQEVRSYLRILVPIFICEFFWVLGENVYGFLYGHMGTKACAAMTLINPVVSLLIGAMSGIAQAAGIMIGKLLGAGENEKAFVTSKRLMKTGLTGSILLSVILLLLQSLYVQIFQVEPEVRQMTCRILTAFAILAPVKVENMILGGGILRSGGKTNYVMAVDLIGTWMFGVPLGFLTAFWLKLPIAEVYFILSLEEMVRFLISVGIFRRKKWMQQL